MKPVEYPLVRDVTYDGPLPKPTHPTINVTWAEVPEQHRANFQKRMWW